MKKSLLKTLVQLLCLFLFLGIAQANLIINGSFEEKRGSLPDRWQTDAYDITHRTIHFSHIKDIPAHSGDYFLQIENVDESDSRFVQIVSVKPKSYYK